MLDWRFINGKPTAGPHYIMAIKKHKTTGELVYDYFTFKGASNKKITIEILEENVPMPEGVTENKWSSNRINKYFWYAVGNKVMFYDPNPAMKTSYHYTTADSEYGEITTLTVGPCSDTRQKNQLAVGYANKKVVFYNIDELVLQLQHLAMLKSTETEEKGTNIFIGKLLQQVYQYKLKQDTRALVKTMVTKSTNA